MSPAELLRAALAPLRYGAAPLLPPGSWLRTDEPVARLRRLARQALDEVPPPPSLLQLPAGLLWAPLIGAQALRNLARHGEVAVEHRGRARQLVDMLVCAWRLDISPANYYRFRLFEPEQRAQARQLIQPHELRALHRRVNAGLDWGRLDRKPSFFAHCRAHDLPTPEVWAVAQDGEVRWLLAEERLPPRDLVLKATALRAGMAFERWTRDPQRDAWRRGEELLDQAGLLARLRERSRDKPCFVQERLRPHPELAGLALDGTLCTVRVVTWRAPDGQAGVIELFFRMPSRAGTEVDNIGAGGIGAPLDLRTGRLMVAGGKGPAEYARHPASGAPIEGRVLPCWEQLVPLCLRAHATVPEFPFVGWDVGLAEGGPTLLEANTMWGVPDAPFLGHTPYVQLALARLTPPPDRS